MNANNSQTIRSQRYFRLAMLALVLAVAGLAYFLVMPRAAQSKPVAQNSIAIHIAVQSPVLNSAGWVYYQDSLNAKWYAVHYSMPPTGPVIDEPIELSSTPGVPSANRDACGQVSSSHYPVDC